jgi:pyruvate ferredoxin oxidoreductase delta subunit
MYNVAFVEDEKCVAQKGCRLCIMYCPEADCIRLDTRQMKAFVNIDKCKGCELCVVVCNAAKHNAILMAPVDGKTGKIILGKSKAEAAGLGQAYQG